MSNGMAFDILHAIVTWLETPVIFLLLGVVAFTIWEIGVSCGEYWRGLKEFAQHTSLDQIEKTGGRGSKKRMSSRESVRCLV